mmetsp:Transcript_100636/g.225591  ORF Transcript_100636/g.225591 Transcript_100636/m.225591 type:complete len:227 (+) Transcript_100636:259-939(+)
MASLFTRSVLSEATSPFSVEISVSRIPMASLFLLILSVKLALVLSQVAFVLAHSVSSSVFLSVNSPLSVFNVSKMPCEWYLKVGSIGSTFSRSAETSCRRPAVASLKEAATSMLFSTELLIERSELGFASSSAWIALVSPRSALERSAASASYSAWSLTHCSVVCLRSKVICSWFAWRSFSSEVFFAFSAVFCSMSAESESILSLPVVMLVDLALVCDLQKQANWS